jgi:hypothetical protein
MAEPIRFTDFLFKEASVCPLKINYYQSEPYGLKSYKYYIKKLTRDAVSLLFPPGNQTDDDTQTAFEQTLQWLQLDQVVIYGAVLRFGVLQTRIPILVKDKNDFTLVQIHGKLWKSHERDMSVFTDRSSSSAEYTREAAYRVWILQKMIPDSSVKVDMFFPDSKFRSVSDNLFRKLSEVKKVSKELIREVESLFVKVDGTAAVMKIFLSPGAEYLHPLIPRKTLSEQIQYLTGAVEEGMEMIIHPGCRNCSFRTSGALSGEKGCWDTHLKAEDAPALPQVFELIGHGNDAEVASGYHYQHQIEIPETMNTFDDLITGSGSTITLQQRRGLQLLAANDKRLPREWIKPTLLKNLSSLKWPLHFIDFEAATSAIPMTMAGFPYEPLLFQFSCHTLYENGEIVHSSYLKKSESDEYITEFTDELLSIPDINSGTILHYSPYEKQALHKLLKIVSRSSRFEERMINGLQEMISGDDSVNAHNRFVDLSKWVRDFYFNSEMTGSLGLKHIFLSVLRISESVKEKYSEIIPGTGIDFPVVETNSSGGINDPYSQIQTASISIEDGSSAMYAWIYSRMSKNKEAIYKDLETYCNLDSLAMVILTEHWIGYSRHLTGENDVILY